MFFLIFTSIGVCYTIYHVIQNIDEEYIDTRKKRWQNLNKMMATKYSSPSLVKIMSFYMIFKFFYLQLIQYLTDSVKKIDKNHYQVTYVINGKLYKMIVKPERGPAEYDEILNEKNENIIEEVLTYYGPHHKNQVKLKPVFFKSKFLRIKKYDETEIIVDEHEHIIL